ncbi:hypothetical protein Ddye_021600, partial [Dipteronia dyeriana]
MVCDDDFHRTMDRIRTYLPTVDGSNYPTEVRGLYVSKNMTYEELVSIVQTIVKYDVNKYIVDLHSISIVPTTTCRTLIKSDNDVQFMLGEDMVIPQVCVSLIERVAEDVIAEDIPHRENTQQFRSFSE